MKKIPIIYADNHIVAVNKPPGIPVQTGKPGGLSIIILLKEQLSRKDNKYGNIFLAPIHRIDREVTGILLFVRTRKSAQRLSEQFRKHTKELKKTYVALTKGRLSPQKGKLVDKLLEKNGKLKESSLLYEIVASHKNYSIFRLQLITGRYHQIRKQLSKRGVYILGDKRYGSRERFKKAAIALHAYEIRFIHPVKQELMTLKAPLPPFWQPIVRSISPHIFEEGFKRIKADGKPHEIYLR